MIHKVRIRNFKCLQDVTIELERFTVFVGANASGKTSVLQAIHTAARAVSGGQRKALAIGDPKKVFTRDRHGDWIYTRGGAGELSICCETIDGPFSVEATRVHGEPTEQGRIQKPTWEYLVSPVDSPLLAAIEPARRMVALRLSAFNLAKASYSRVNPPLIHYTGQGLASVLAYMALNDPQGFEDLTAEARLLIPRLQRIRFRKATVRQTENELIRFGEESVVRRSRRRYQGESILLDFENAENISARNASEGTMLMLGLLTVLRGPNRPKIVLLDDLEHGLHPLAQKQIVGVINQFVEKYSDLQVLATAHSPYLLNFLTPEQVRIMAVGPDGYTLCGQLADHPKFATWKEEMAPGEMWSLFGEKWLAEAGAAS